jgi:DNA-binding response OmpR family regulator
MSVLSMRTAEVRRGSATPQTRPGPGTQGAPERPNPLGNDPRNSDVTVLLVEDDDQIRRVLLHFLNDAGYTVLEAPSAEEALAVAETWPGPIQVLLTDYSLPGLSGDDLQRAVRAVREETHVILMSASGLPGEVGRLAREAGLRFLPKPFSRQSLLANIRAALEGRTTP